MQSKTMRIFRRFTWFIALWFSAGVCLQSYFGSLEVVGYTQPIPIKVAPDRSTYRIKVAMPHIGYVFLREMPPATDTLQTVALRNTFADFAEFHNKVKPPPGFVLESPRAADSSESGDNTPERFFIINAIYEVNPNALVSIYLTSLLVLILLVLGGFSVRHELPKIHGFAKSQVQRITNSARCFFGLGISLAIGICCVAAIVAAIILVVAIAKWAWFWFGY